MRSKGQVAKFVTVLMLAGASALLDTPAADAEYVTLLESDADAGAGQEIFLVSYNSFADLVNQNPAGATFSQLNVNPAYSVGGLTYDGSQFQLLLESNADLGAGQEIFLVSYNSFADLVNQNPAGATFSQLNVNPAYSVGGLAFVPDNGGGGGGGAVPEPPSILLLLAGLLALMFSRAARKVA